MKKFESNLHRLKDIRQAATTRCETDLAQAQRALEEALSRQLHWKNSLAAAEGTLEKQSLQPCVSQQECIAHRAWFQHLADCLHKNKIDCQKKDDEVAARREKLKKAMMDQKVVENLSLRERNEWLKQLRKAEQKETDEAAAQCTLRNVIPSTNDPLESFREGHTE